MKNYNWLLLLLLLASIIVNCNQLAGGVSDETTNGLVAGVILDSSGEPSGNTHVYLIPTDYTPTQTKGDVIKDSTDNDGRYFFNKIKHRTYTIKAQKKENHQSGIVFNLKVASGDTLHVEPVVLSKSGEITVVLNDTQKKKKGFIYLAGTDIAVAFDGSDSAITIPDVPAGSYSALKYISDDNSSEVLRYAVAIASGDMKIINAFWQHAGTIQFNTTAKGANITEDVYDFPVLIRLSDANFNFSQAQTHGEDVRFYKSDGVLLSHEIERWDQASRRAEVWVRVDTIFGNSSTQQLLMLWGSPSAVSNSNSGAVFDTSIGFQGVWHLAASLDGKTPDATNNGYSGTSIAVKYVEGSIGLSAEFNENAKSAVSIEKSADGKLNFPADGDYSVSAWVNADSSLENKNIVAKGDLQYYLSIHNSEWRFTQYNSNSTQGWDYTLFPCTYKKWVYLTGVRKGLDQYLYVNGICVDSTLVVNNDGAARDESSDVEIGRRFINGRGGLYYSGVIDEVRLCSTARSKEWIKLSYENQVEKSTFVTLKK